MEDLLKQVKEYRKAQLATARDLKAKGAPIEQINDSKNRAHNIVSIFEAYVCMTNLAKQFGDECLTYAVEHKAKLDQMLAA